MSDPVVIGGLAMGKYLVPGTPLGGRNPADRNEPPLSGGQRYSIAGTHQRANIPLRSADVRFTSESGHSPTRSACLFRAINEHCRVSVSRLLKQTSVISRDTVKSQFQK
jgi:hypothetical protein